MAEPTLQIDALIFGGGVAGLWLLDELHRRSFGTLLIEHRALGAGQTIASQGILHGGLKYALGGMLSGSAKAVGEITDHWRECLDGRAKPDLRGVRILSPCCYLWRTKALASMVGLTAARIGLRTPVTKVAPQDRPSALVACPGDVLRVDEQVIDTGSLLKVLADRHADRIINIAGACNVTFTTSKPGHVETVELRPKAPSPQGEHQGERDIPTSNPTAYSLQPIGRGEGSSAVGESHVLLLKPRVVIFTAGEGNAELRRRVGLTPEAMQLRPLHMVMVRGPLPQLFGHCVDGNKTRVTVTSALDTHGRTVWQVGGEIAEKGVHMNAAELIQFARSELRSVLPAVDFTNTGWATYKINRAEGLDPHGARPEGPVWRREGSVITAWPTKLVLAPRLAELIVDALGKLHPSPFPPGGVIRADRGGRVRGQGEGALECALHLNWPRPDVAQPPWEVTDEWHD